jgi:hypothetical protein
MNTTLSSQLKGNKKVPCVSIIVPTHKKSPERRMDELTIEKAIAKAKTILLNKYGNNGTVTDLTGKLETLVKDLDHVHNDKGIGLFASGDTSCVIKFPFEVKEKIVVGDSFEIRDVLYLEETMADYYVLLLNENKIKLFSGNGEILHEVKDRNFPMEFYDDYEYSKPSRGTSFGNTLKGFEKDKSIVKEQRQIANLKKADKKLSAYTANNTPFVVIGDSKELGYFVKANANHINIAAKVNGNYSHNNLNELGQLTFKKIKSYLGREQKSLFKKLEEAIGKKQAVIGIRAVWKAAKESKGLLLLVEKDYVWSGFVKKTSNELFMRAPVEEHVMVTDAVDDVMEEVLAKGGEVVVVENGQLEEFDHIALLLRYE